MNVRHFYPGGGYDPYNSATTYRMHVVALLSRDVLRARVASKMMESIRRNAKQFLNEAFGRFVRRSGI